MCACFRPDFPPANMERLLALVKAVDRNFARLAEWFNTDSVNLPALERKWREEDAARREPR